MSSGISKKLICNINLKVTTIQVKLHSAFTTFCHRVHVNYVYLHLLLIFWRLCWILLYTSWLYNVRSEYTMWQPFNGFSTLRGVYHNPLLVPQAAANQKPGFFHGGSHHNCRGTLTIFGALPGTLVAWWSRKYTARLTINQPIVFKKIPEWCFKNIYLYIPMSKAPRLWGISWSLPNKWFIS